ncbi:hypothetical protein J120_02360 [candidate division TM6 bacterium JCVI TM6SC1]|uniref:Uncharacterized protein n=1 Tax=candidate division TM6 bacterium JCVI TM6SC1 TaxID=1306947 RepID=A0A0D2JDT4_9BACT|nr:hypothetical protein J120_02360 [candidate division TM6 bacterium JCVI TM6SC1]
MKIKSIFFLVLLMVFGNKELYAGHRVATTANSSQQVSVPLVNKFIQSYEISTLIKTTAIISAVSLAVAIGVYMWWKKSTNSKHEDKTTPLESSIDRDSQDVIHQARQYIDEVLVSNDPDQVQIGDKVQDALDNQTERYYFDRTDRQFKRTLQEPRYTQNAFEAAKLIQKHKSILCNLLETVWEMSVRKPQLIFDSDDISVAGNCGQSLVNYIIELRCKLERLAGNDLLSGSQVRDIEFQAYCQVYEHAIQKNSNFRPYCNRDSAQIAFDLIGSKFIPSLYGIDNNSYHSSVSFNDLKCRLILAFKDKFEPKIVNLARALIRFHAPCAEYGNKNALDYLHAVFNTEEYYPVSNQEVIALFQNRNPVLYTFFKSQLNSLSKVILQAGYVRSELPDASGATFSDFLEKEIFSRGSSLSIQFYRNLASVKPISY